MDWKNLGIASVAYAAISQVVHSFGAMADMPYYTDPGNVGLWSKMLMPGGGAPGLNFTLLAMFISLITGIIFGAAFIVLKQNFKQRAYLNRGLSFGIFLFILIGVPSFLSIALLFAVPLGLQLSWLTQSLVVSLSGGIAFARLL